MFLEATLCDDDLYEVNPIHLWLDAENDKSVSHIPMLTKVEAVDLLHWTLGHAAVQRIEDAINTGHVDWCLLFSNFINVDLSKNVDLCNESLPSRFKKQTNKQTNKETNKQNQKQKQKQKQKQNLIYGSYVNLQNLSDTLSLLLNLL